MPLRSDRFYTCKHSRRRPVSGYGSRSLGVYASCRNPEKCRVGKHYMLRNRETCKECGCYKSL